ncbi:MAG: hypothetical protein H0U75_01990 [Legionella sp.]|nr:hypothetical protein [Legionella sp.]
MSISYNPFIGINKLYHHDYNFAEYLLLWCRCLLGWDSNYPPINRFENPHGLPSDPDRGIGLFDYIFLPTALLKMTIEYFPKSLSWYHYPWAYSISFLGKLTHYCNMVFTGLVTFALLPLLLPLVYLYKKHIDHERTILKTIPVVLAHKMQLPIMGGEDMCVNQDIFFGILYSTKPTDTKQYINFDNLFCNMILLCPVYFTDLNDVHEAQWDFVRVNSPSFILGVFYKSRPYSPVGYIIPCTETRDAIMLATRNNLMELEHSIDTVKLKEMFKNPHPLKNRARAALFTFTTALQSATKIKDKAHEIATPHSAADLFGQIADFANITPCDKKAKKSISDFLHKHPHTFFVTNPFPEQQAGNQGHATLNA